ncbi:MAG: hypothetical protein J6X70_08320 [Muribaculaceae bacterium]|nr:hypothetical protein [Muribaculaceae bacterium]
MIKKILLALLLAAPLALAAQDDDGLWTSHANVSSANITNCIDNGDQVYSLISNTVFSYDKATGVITTLREAEGMSDTKVEQIYQHYDKRLVVAAYDNANIDVIDARGRITNLPQINNAIMGEAKIVNDITFAGDRMVVATGFGVVIFDLNDMCVENSFKFNTNITSAAILGNQLFITTSDGTYVGQVGTLYGSLAQMTKSSTATGRIYPLDDTHLLRYSTSLFLGTVSGTAISYTTVVAGTPKSVLKTPTGYVVSFYSSTGYYTFNPDGSNATANTGTELYTTTEAGNWWVLGGNGLAHIVNGVKGAYTALNGVTIDQYAFWLAYDKWGERMLLGRCGNALDTGSDWKPYNMQVNAYDGENWHNVTPTGAPAANGEYEFAVSPIEPNTYYFSTRSNGTAKVIDDQWAYTLTASNTALLSDRRSALAFDSQNNLWFTTNRSGKKVLALRPAGQTGSTLPTADAWVQVDIPDGLINANFKKNKFAIGKGDTKVFCIGDNSTPVVFWQSDPTTLATTRTVKMTTFNAEGGASIAPSYVNTIKADRTGRVWIGSWSGVQSFDPSQAWDDDFKVRNHQPTDGEFTLTTTTIHDIAVDTLNRKWIGTQSYGLVLVDEDGDRVLRHFDSSNSPLASDQIYQVAVNEKTNAVFVTTPEGVYEWDENGVVTIETQAYCYPNPVLPDYTGMVTFRQLARDATFTVVNAAGNTVATLTSTGNIALWDACDAAGNRVPTGNYRVLNGDGIEVVTLQVIK